MLSRLNIYYRVVLISILVILINQAFIQFFLYQKRTDAEVLNLSGRQRMLSQRLLVQRIVNNTTQVQSGNSEFAHVYEEWINSHNLLKEKIVSPGLPCTKLEDIKKQLVDLEPMMTAAKHYIVTTRPLRKKEIEAFKVNQDTYLERMNTIVSKLEAHSNFKLQKVIYVEIALALIALFMIYYEVNFIFKRINEKLKKKNKALKASNQLLEQYAYLAAHDLSAPVQNILNFSSLLQPKISDRLTTEENHYFSFITEAAKRMKALTRDLLIFASLNQNRIVINDCSPQTIIKEVMKDLKVQIDDKKARISVGALPETIKADQQLMRIVFQNFISNGLKFVPAQRAPEVVINYRSKKDQHIFEIRDNGIGIDTAYQTKIFKLFKKLHHQQEFAGTGIGLSICQKIIEKHHGEIGVESVKDQGSTFFFSLAKNQQN